MTPIPSYCSIPTGLKRGDNGDGVKRLQEWLTLSGSVVTVDGDFGPATERVLKARTGSAVVDAQAVTLLTLPMVRALNARGSIVDVARAYLAEHPREVGGQNRGPWVRSFTGGHEGPAWAWCDFFVRAVAGQAGAEWAAKNLTGSCDVQGARAKRDGRLSATPIIGGSFLVRGASKADPWTHTGIVVDAGPGWVATIEGNSNDEGSREGHEVCARTRGTGRLDFVRLA